MCRGWTFESRKKELCEDDSRPFSQAMHEEAIRTLEACSGGNSACQTGTDNGRPTYTLQQNGKTVVVTEDSGEGQRDIRNVAIMNNEGITVAHFEPSEPGSGESMGKLNKKVTTNDQPTKVRLADGREMTWEGGIIITKIYDKDGKPLRLQREPYNSKQKGVSEEIWCGAPPKNKR